MKKKLNIYQNFVTDWKKIIDSQDKQSYEKFFKIFSECISSLWEYRTDAALTSIEQQCYNISYCLLGSEKKFIKGKGIQFVQATYKILWSIIEEKRPLLNQYKCGFSLFTEICSELVQSIDEMNIEDAERRLDFDNLVNSVLIVTIWLVYDKEKNLHNKEEEDKPYKYKYQSDISELNSFATHIGYYLGKQNNKNNMINQRVWANTLDKWSIFSTFNILEERRDAFLNAKVNIYFCYCYGMIVNGQENVVKMGLYLSGMTNTFKLENRYQALLYLVVHCYIYYLAVRESNDCVTPDIRQSALNIWNDKGVKGAFLHFLNVLSRNSQWLDLDMHNQMYEIVYKFELFPQYEHFKYIIINSVTLDFYLFLILFMSHEFFLPDLLERSIDDMQAFRYVSDGNEYKTKDMLCKLFKTIYIGNKDEKQIDKEVDLMYDDLEKMVKKKQKERCIRLARNM